MQDVESPLLPGERVLWDGRPLRRRIFRRPDVLLVPVSLLWCGFVVSLEGGALSSGAPFFFALWGLPFVLFGVYLVAGRFVVRVVSFRHTHYAITERRVLVHSGWSGGRVSTQYLNSLPPPVITEEPDGSGSLAFGRFPGLAEVFIGGRPGWRDWSSEPSPTPILWMFPTSAGSATSWPTPRHLLRHPRGRRTSRHQRSRAAEVLDRAAPRSRDGQSISATAWENWAA